MGSAADVPVLPGLAAHDDYAWRWTNVTGTIFKPLAVKDCLTQAACTPLALPPGFTQDLFEWALNRSIEAQRRKFQSKPEASQVL